VRTGQFRPLERSIPPRRYGQDRVEATGRRPDHADKGIARELVRASSASCLYIADQCGAKCSAGSPPRDQSSLPARPAAPPGRSIHPKCGDDRYGGTSGNAKELRKGVRQSERIIVARGARRPNDRRKRSGHRLPRRGRAGGREAGKPGTTAVRGTWCSAGEVPGVISAKAGHAGDTPVGQRSPMPLAATGTDRHSGT
jgi:hypothetical protein